MPVCCTAVYVHSCFQGVYTAACPILCSDTRMYMAAAFDTYATHHRLCEMKSHFSKSNHWTRSMNNSVNCLSACVLETADISMTSFVIRSDVEGYSGIVPRSFRFLKCLNKATGFSPYLRTSSGDTTFAGSMLSQNHSKNGTTASCSNVQSKASPWNSLAFG